MGFWGGLWERVSRAVAADRQKWGGMTPGAMGRLGLAELRQAVALDGSVASQMQTPLGMYGTLTPGEVSAARQGEDAGPVVDLEVAAAGPDRATEADPVAKAQGQSAASATPSADREQGGGKG